MRCALGIRLGLGFMQRRTGQLALMHTGHLLCAQHNIYMHTNTGTYMYITTHLNTGQLLCAQKHLMHKIFMSTGQLLYALQHHWRL